MVGRFIGTYLFKVWRWHRERSRDHNTNTRGEADDLGDPSPEAEEKAMKLLDKVVKTTGAQWGFHSSVFPEVRVASKMHSGLYFRIGYGGCELEDASRKPLYFEEKFTGKKVPVALSGTKKNYLCVSTLGNLPYADRVAALVLFATYNEARLWKTGNLI